jgi:ABC-type Fe3+/spermidine/putrescine transport system ATPase subunit
VTAGRLSAQDLTIGYPGRQVAEGITLDVSPGEILAIIGPSGSGKSTLLSTLAGVVPALSGRIVLDDVDITTTPIHARRIGLIFQEPLLFPHLDVIGNVTYGLRRQGMSRDLAEARARELLEWLDLPDYAHRSVDELSGGQSQRVALARALAPRPTVLLLDEPFSALDVELRQRLVTDVAAMLRHEEVGAIHVTHDPDEATRMADRVLTMAQISKKSNPALR